MTQSLGGTSEKSNQVKARVANSSDPSQVTYKKHLGSTSLQLFRVKVAPTKELGRNLPSGSNRISAFPKMNSRRLKNLNGMGQRSMQGATFEGLTEVHTLVESQFFDHSIFSVKLHMTGSPLAEVQS